MTTIRKFPVPPTYAEPTIVDPNSGKAQFNPIWLKWFLDVAQFLSGVGLTITQQIDHNALGDLQGGALGQFYHLTAAQQADLFVNPITTPGDMIIGSGGGGTPVALPVGTNGRVLTVVAGLPAWV